MLIERVHSFLFSSSLFSSLHRGLPERCCHLFRENFARHDVRIVHLCECARASRTYVRTYTRGIHGITGTFRQTRWKTLDRKYPTIFPNGESHRTVRPLIRCESGNVNFSRKFFGRSSILKLGTAAMIPPYVGVDNQIGSRVEIRFRGDIETHEALGAYFLSDSRTLYISMKLTSHRSEYRLSRGKLL